MDLSVTLHKSIRQRNKDEIETDSLETGTVQVRMDEESARIKGVQKKALVMSMGITAAFAQTVAYSGTDGDGATITVNNPAKGETYKVHKLFDATVSSDGKISYQCPGDIPAGLTSFFSKDANNNVIPADSICEKDDGGNVTGTKMTDALKAALETWAASAAAAAEAVSEGDALEFTGLPYGYYVMTTTHKSDPVGDAEAKAAITVCSTKPNATINDKNVNVPSADKVSDKESYSVGDTVTYTATFNAPNYMEKAGTTTGESEQVVSYTIKDTLPAFLSDVAITSVQVKQPGVAENVSLSGYTAFDSTTKSITIPWVNEEVPSADHTYTSTYKAGSQIIITYTATLTSAANIGAGNVNTVSIMPNVDRGNGPEPYQETDQWHDDASITTHAAALQKKANSEDGDNLAGAKFKFKGLTLTGSAGMYTVVSYDPNGAADSGTEVECDSDGKLVIGGIDKAITLVGTETKAPEGFNQLTGTFDLPTIQMGTTTTTTWGSRTTYYDAEGNVVDEEVEGGSSTTTTTGEYATISDIPVESIAKVVNRQGTELPSTGGIGTTIFYVVGSILVVAAGVLLITKKRMSREG